MQTVSAGKDLHFCLDRQFTSAEQCTEIWRLLGCDYQWLQISPGPLNGRIRVERQQGMILVSIQADQALLVQGARNPDWVPFTLEHTDNIAEHRHFGEALSPRTLGGFNTRLDQTLLRTSPGGSQIGAVLLDRRRIEQMAALDPFGRLQDHLDGSNTAVLSEASHQGLKLLMEPPAWQGFDAHGCFQADLLEAQLFDALASEPDSCLRPVTQTHRSDLVREVVEFSFRNRQTPMTLQEVCRALFTTKTTLTVSCREMFGFGPMLLLKRVRLQQVHHVLSNPDLQRQLGCRTIHAVASYFGFYSRNHFSRDYRALFGESPRDTLHHSAA